MCGIFCILNNCGLPERVTGHDETTRQQMNDINYMDENIIQCSFEKGKGRGPETSKLLKVADNVTLGFHRLAINGLDQMSDQPIEINGVYLICNGEIYNYKELYQLMPDIRPKTNSDCEIILHLYIRYGIEQTLQMLDGVFAFVILDTRLTLDDNGTTRRKRMFMARDPYGVRPMYMLTPKYIKTNSEDKLVDTPQSQQTSKTYAFASELKSLIPLKNVLHHAEIKQFSPGSYSGFIEEPYNSSDVRTWSHVKSMQNITYTSQGFRSTMVYQPMIDYHLDVLGYIQQYLKSAIIKRTVVTDRPVACLLSGGLDSSLITALVNDVRKHVLKREDPLETYSIGIEGSADLVYAKKVAEYLGTKHTEVVLSEQEFFDAIPEVIKAIESYDTTTVRASIGNYLLGKYISQHSDAKVIFNGDGSDELCGGYLYMHACRDPIEFDKECRRLLKNIYTFDVLRSDKSISSHGLEPRTPFLDRAFVDYYLSIHPNVRCHSNKDHPEKYLLRTAFSKPHCTTVDGKALLPDEILWRTKEAFSDGVSNTSRSTLDIIQENIRDDWNIIEKLGGIDWSKFADNEPQTMEQKYYRYLFENEYKNCGNVIPFFWMPKYVKAIDSSARKLPFYKTVIENEKNLSQPEKEQDEQDELDTSSVTM
jgi:asparagine synthase (glutamine-hydrolysing)